MCLFKQYDKGSKEKEDTAESKLLDLHCLITEEYKGQCSFIYFFEFVEINWAIFFMGFIGIVISTDKKINKYVAQIISTNQRNKIKKTCD